MRPSVRRVGRVELMEKSAIPDAKSATAALAFMVMAPPRPLRSATSNAHPVSTVMLTVIRNSAIADVTRPWIEDSTGRIDMFINADDLLSCSAGWMAVAMLQDDDRCVGVRVAATNDQREYAAGWPSGQ
jgi:hypothetical protein